VKKLKEMGEINNSLADISTIPAMVSKKLFGGLQPQSHS
jgi:hypothetical protein